MSDDEPLAKGPADVASRAARDLLEEDWLWSLGSDTGADTWAYFQTWRAENPSDSPLEFLDRLLQAWEVPAANWDLADPVIIQDRLKDDHFALLTRDDAVVAVAFSQLILDGRVDRELRARALLALSRQALSEVTSFRTYATRR